VILVSIKELIVMYTLNIQGKIVHSQKRQSVISHKLSCVIVNFCMILHQ